MLRLVMAAIVALLIESPTAEAQQEAAVLVGPEWRLVRYGDITSPKSPPTSPRALAWPATLRFGVSETGMRPPAGEDSLSVFDGCNHALGLSYRVNADRLIVTFSKGWGTTLMACPEEQQPLRAAVIGGLQKSERFIVQKNMLTIFYEVGKSALVFEAPAH
jgi:hypothetical protein